MAKKIKDKNGNIIFDKGTEKGVKYQMIHMANDKYAVRTKTPNMGNIILERDNLDTLIRDGKNMKYHMKKLGI